MHLAFIGKDAEKMSANRDNEEHEKQKTSSKAESYKTAKKSDAEDSSSLNVLKHLVFCLELRLHWLTKLYCLTKTVLMETVIFTLVSMLNIHGSLCQIEWVAMPNSSGKVTQLLPSGWCSCSLFSPVSGSL